jgi:uncharacterized membrane protein
VPVFAVEIYDVVKALHIMAVVGAFGLPLAYPMLFAYAQKRHGPQLGALHDIQLRLNQRITGPGTVLILVFGIYLASKGDYWSKVWVTVPLIILIVIGGVGGALINPSVRRLSELAGTPGYAGEYKRYLRFEILLGVLVLVAIFFMAAKP